MVWVVTTMQILVCRSYKHCALYLTLSVKYSWTEPNYTTSGTCTKRIKLSSYWKWNPITYVPIWQSEITYWKGYTTQLLHQYWQSFKVQLTNASLAAWLCVTTMQLLVCRLTYWRALILTLLHHKAYIVFPLNLRNNGWE